MQEGTERQPGYPEETKTNDNDFAMTEKNQKKFRNDSCPIRNVLDRFGDKWSILILLTLHEHGTMRFNELRGEMEDISQKMLTVTLRTLEADNLVQRKMYPEIPPRVEYTLTERGRSLMPHIEGLTAWALENMQQIMRSRKKFAEISAA